jgi:hypothetical protein
LTSGYDNLIFNQPSVFLQEVSDNLLERVELEEAYDQPDTGSEDMIVWDDSGEEIKQKKKRRSILREIDEL